MVQKEVQLRPNDFPGDPGLNDYLEELIGRPVPSTKSIPPIYFFATTEENVQKIREKYGDKVNITVHDVNE